MRLKDTPKGANLVFLMVILINIGMSFAAEILLQYGIDIFFGSITIQLVISQVAFILPIVIYMICTKTSVKIFRFKKVDILTILLCVLLYICLTPILNFFNAVSMLYSTNMISDVMLGIADEVPFVVGLLMIAIVPAFFEEMTYRGFFYNTYRRDYPFGAVLMCGLLFGLVHGNLNQFTYAFILGMAFALIMEATDSIWTTITAHFLVNMSSVLFLYVLPTLLKFLETVYNSYVAAGNQQAADMIVNALGTDNFSMDAVTGLTGTLPKEIVLQSIATYTIPAVIGGVLAFFLYRFIAKRCGRWEQIKYVFTRRSKRNAVPAQTADVPVQPESEPALVSEATVPAAKPKLITWEFVVGAVMMFGLMVLSEVLMRIMA